MKRLATAAILILIASHAFGTRAVKAGGIAGEQAPPQRTQSPSTDGKLNIIAFGAHPDDCDQRAGGTAAKYAALGHRVRFVSVTNGDAGHQTEGGGALAARRRAEARESGRRLGIDYVVLDNHDGELLPTLAVREQIIRQIRIWNADLVLAPRPNDYHPDHRYTGILVQDAAYMVVVPNVAPDTPALRKNPVFMYFEDVDYSRRVSRHFRMVYTPKATVYHRSGGGDAWSRQTPTYLYYMTRNRVRAFRDRSAFYRAYLVLVSFAAAVSKSVAILVGGRRRDQQLGALWRGFVAGAH